MPRGFLFSILILLTIAPAIGEIKKVLPHLLDKQGRHSDVPSLYERDAYQAWLHANLHLCRTLAFDIHWKAAKSRKPLELRLEYRAEKSTDTRSISVRLLPKNSSARWTRLQLTEDEFRNLGTVTMWRVTLWDEGRLVGEQRSFLWSSQDEPPNREKGS